MTDRMGATPIGERESASLVFENVTKRFGTVQAVDRLSLEVRGGEFLTILGPSGSGKTTALNMVLGTLTPDAGEIRVDGRPITRIPMHRRNFGMVFQNYALFPHMTIFDNIAFPLRMRGITKDEVSSRAAESLALVQLAGYEHRYPRELSGGQQQRVATARALVAHPDVILMDEPLGALDKQLREHMQEELRLLQRRLGMTTLYVTHDQSEAMGMSDRIAVMNQGRLEQVGPPQEVYERPQNTFVAGFLGNANLIPARVHVSKGHRCEVVSPTGLQFPAAAEEHLVAGREVTVLIRPERIELFPDSEPPGDNTTLEGRLFATVRDAVYAGADTKYELSSESGEMLRVNIPRRNGAHTFSPGDRVQARWLWNDARILS